MYINKTLNKSDVEFLLKELSKNIRKMNGKVPPTEIIIVGGASILLNYSFRNTTLDIDALNSDYSTIKMAINKVTDDYKLNNSWINSDFKYTESFTPQLRRYAEYYKTFANCVNVYTIKDEYLIAMKIIAARVYKSDISDIVGIIKESKSKITFDQIDKAMRELYDGWQKVNEETKQLIEVFCNMTYKELEETYDILLIEEETNRKEILRDITEDHDNETDDIEFE